MLFHSQVFLAAFLPAVLTAFHLVAGSPSARKLILVVASIAFYAAWDYRYVPLLLGLAAGTWLCARLFLRVTRSVSSSGKANLGGMFLAAGIALNLGALALFKYADFLGANLTALAGLAWHPLGLVLPLGISFFVFQKISYLIDLKRGDRHAYRFLDFAVFVSFFPQLIAGPLVRHNEIIPQLDADPRGPALWENLSRGTILFIIGMAKKLALADTIAPNVDHTFALAAGAIPNLAASWATAAGYALQIYFDFSGYSDMAIGLALMFGLRLPMNFDAPYRAVSIRDFWRRWHITLSRFLRDYLYIPLGGNRRGPSRQAVNVLLTMLIGGLWHGANWTFVLWGGLHGMALAINGAWYRRRWKCPRLLGWLATLIFVTVAWVVFRAPTFDVAGRILVGLAGAGGAGALGWRDAWVLPLGAAVALLGPTSQQAAFARLRPRLWIAMPMGLAFAALFFLSGGRLHDAFIYFQF